jgi:hypothetical protein
VKTTTLLTSHFQLLTFSEATRPSPTSSATPCAQPTSASPPSTPPSPTSPQPPGAASPIDPAHFVIREVEDPIDEVALIAYIRKLLSQRDWDGRIETFGIPPTFIILPPDVPPGEVDRYRAMCEAIISDARGVLPSGSDVKTLDIANQGPSPFLEHLRYQDEQIVMAGTAGKLSMLTDATGLGSGAAEMHKAVFDTIAEAEAAEISAIIHRQLDLPLLAHAFPGEPALAGWSLSAKPADETEKVLSWAQLARDAGAAVDWEELSKRSGIALAASPPIPALPAPQPGEEVVTSPSNLPPPPPVAPQAPAAALEARHEPASGQQTPPAQQTTPGAELLGITESAATPAAYHAALERIRDEFPALARQIYTSTRAADALGEALAQAASLALAESESNDTSHLSLFTSHL